MPSFDIWILVSSPIQGFVEGTTYIFTFGGFVCWKKIPEVHRSNRKLQDSDTKLHITSIIHKERIFLKRCASKPSKLFSRITARKIRTTESPSSGSRTQNLTNSGSVTCEWSWRTRPNVLCVTNQMSRKKKKRSSWLNCALWDHELTSPKIGPSRCARNTM